MVGTWKNHDAMIKAIHQRFLDVACAHGLKWDYEHVDNCPKNLEHLINNSIGSNIEDVITEIKFHHEIIKSNKLPIPRCKHMMPNFTTKWNLKKAAVM